MVRYILFLVYPLELLYRLGFHIVIAHKRRHANKDPFPFKIIAVGNLTVGGTGKSVVVPFLVDLLGRDQSAVVLRGYRGSLERDGRAALVSDGRAIVVTREQSGDEAMMYAQQLGVPIAIGADRSRACKLLTGMNSKIKYVILDDAYQNYSVKKDIEILLLDARAPFDNGHCLPLGRLREKDYTRATFIVLTHADNVDRTTLEYIKRIRLKKFAYEKIYEGKHASAGIYRENKDRVETFDVKSKNFLVVAGVGSFDGVVASVQQAGCSVRATKQYRDHHNYTVQNLDDVRVLMHKTSCDSVITTAKDWVKLAPLLDQEKAVGGLPIFVIRVAFEFLSPSEQNRFGDALCLQLERH
jgi:tetraacyldisaccharide 4'-kinase